MKSKPLSVSTGIVIVMGKMSSLYTTKLNLIYLGATRSHLGDFKKHRAARIDHYVIEVNKLIIRLEKVSGKRTRGGGEALA